MSNWRDELPTIPNKNIIDKAAIMDNPAPDNDASVKSLGIFLQQKIQWQQAFWEIQQ